MAETKWMPGPWRWFDYPDGRKLLCATHRAVIHCPDAPMSVDPADAHLIASAPDLYAALEQARREWGAFGSLTGETCSQVDAALAKARGEA